MELPYGYVFLTLINTLSLWWIDEPFGCINKFMRSSICWATSLGNFSVALIWDNSSLHSPGWTDTIWVLIMINVGFGLSKRSTKPNPMFNCLVCRVLRPDLRVDRTCPACCLVVVVVSLPSFPCLVNCLSGCLCENKNKENCVMLASAARFFLLLHKFMY